MMNYCVTKTSLANRAGSTTPCGQPASLELDTQLVPVLPELPEALRVQHESSSRISVAETGA